MIFSNYRQNRFRNIIRKKVILIDFYVLDQTNICFFHNENKSKILISSRFIVKAEIQRLYESYIIKMSIFYLPFIVFYNVNTRTNYFHISNQHKPDFFVVYFVYILCIFLYIRFSAISLQSSSNSRKMQYT